MAARNLENLARDLESKAETIGEEVAHPVMKQIARATLKNLIFATPVDTSQALSNWNVSLGTVTNLAPRGPFVTGSRGSTQDISASQALSKGVGIINQSRPGERIFISNPVDYVVELNQGKSPQAAPGFIENAVQRGSIEGRAQAST